MDVVIGAKNWKQKKKKKLVRVLQLGRDCITLT